MKIEKILLLWVAVFTLVGAATITAWMTRYSVELAGDISGVGNIFIHDRWTGEVAFFMPHPKKVERDSPKPYGAGSYGAAALFSMQEYRTDRQRAAKQARIEAAKQAQLSEQRND